MISIIMSIFNKENVLERVINSLIENSSPLVTEYIFVLDGCVDDSEQIVHKMISKIPPGASHKILKTDNVFETRSNNVGIKSATQKYVCVVQDDMQILEKNWDKRMLEPFRRFEDIFAVTARTAEQMTSEGQYIHGIEGPVGHNCFDKNNSVSRDIFYVNQLVNRGPLMMDLEKVKMLGYFDETLPGVQACDDHDMCIKAYTKYGWRCGCYWIQYYSPLEWGSSRTGGNGKYISEQIELNIREVCKRHKDFLDNWDRNKLYEERFLEDINPNQCLLNLN
jgi:glycosyltransferase involved in cell wall biosynthesis